MDLSGIISISGYPGIFKVISQAKNGVVVESLIDKKRIMAFSHYKISSLGDISIFTTGEDVKLGDVLDKIKAKENSGPATESKDMKELRDYVLSVLPELDQERVHDSDIKKLVSWYNLLQKNDLLKEAPAEEVANDDDKSKVALPKEKAVPTVAKTKTTGSAPKSTGSKAKSTSTIRKTGA